MRLNATFSFMYISMQDFQKYIYTSEFATQRLLITFYLCDDHYRQSTDELPYLIFYIR